MKKIFLLFCVSLSFVNPSVSSATDYGELDSFSEFFDKIVIKGRYKLVIFARSKGVVGNNRAYSEVIKLTNRWVGKQYPIVDTAYFRTCFVLSLKNFPVNLDGSHVGKLNEIVTRQNRQNKNNKYVNFVGHQNYIGLDIIKERIPFMMEVTKQTKEQLMEELYKEYCNPSIEYRD